MSPDAWLLLRIFTWVVIAYFLILNTVYLVTSFFAYGALRRYAQRLKSVDVEDLVASAGAPPITLIAPAFNEASSCVESTQSLLTLKYPAYEVVVVNDGSRDETLARLTEAFDLVPIARGPVAQLATARVRGIFRSRRNPSLWVIDKQNGGKADSLNTGLNYCQTPLFCAIDADSLLEREALLRVVRPFLEDARTVAAGGIIRIVNGCLVRGGQVLRVRLPRNMVVKFQVLEYLRAFLAARMGWNALDTMLIVSGAFGIFRRDTVIEAGGYATDTVGEDMELVVRLHRHCRERKLPYRITFVPDPVAWTECPETLRVLARQRDRWQRGLIETLTRHRTMLLNPRYGRIGMIAFPYFFFLEMLGPVIELGGYVAFVVLITMGWASPMFVLGFFMVALVFGIVLSIAAVGLEELTFRRYQRFGDLVNLFLLSVLEAFGYRQLSTCWRVKGTVSFLRKARAWGSMERKGFSAGRAA